MAEIERGKPRPENDCYRILVLDDNVEQMRTLAEACKAIGQEVVPVTTIAEGMHFLDTKDHVDLVVAEAFMEDESVFEFLKELKSIEEHQNVPIMIVSVEPGPIARLTNELVARTFKMLGACKFVVMPRFELAKLMDEIAAALPREREPKKNSDPENAY
jgi:PleD family two-component response regulator